ncbi:MAG: aminotransferase class I/II-fold pyridoxal phosphate-dependent enzyme [Desulfobacteraceae bacterium]|nr:aminotransferase class I/II-fold pyridoxal phosphate-dependent enzyme [Desulfobacteraceae bacterium]
MPALVSDEHRQHSEYISLLQSQNLYPFCFEVTSPCNHRIVVANRECINFISNNYLGFAGHPKLQEAAEAAVRQYGVGMGGSPLMCGTTEIHNRLKEKIAAVYGQQDTALFASGYQALIGAIQATIGKGDAAMVDGLVHRSIVDGVTLSGSTRRVWVHNNMEDLSSLLTRVQSKYGRKLIIVDSVYSMDGDIAPLPAIKKVRDQHGALVLIDEAHSLGVLGRNGRGILEHFDLPDGADVIAGTFSKFAGAVGGFVTGPKDFILHLRHSASAYIFSASLPPVMCATVLKAFELLEEEPQWRELLWANTRYFLSGLKSQGFDTGLSETPIIPIMIRDVEKSIFFNRSIFEAGVYASPVVYPAVAPSKCRIRLGVMATHTRDDLDAALEIFKKAGKEVGII